MANKNKNAKKSRALLPAPLKCAVCGKACSEQCPGCGWPVHNGCQPKHDCKGGE